MDLTNYRSFYNKGTRFLFWSLVFSFLIVSCDQRKKENSSITILWENEKARAISIPLSLFPAGSTDAIAGHLKVRLTNNPVPVIPEKINEENESIVFKPLIAFTPGLKYEVLYSNKRIGEFDIPPINSDDLAEILAVYPSTDTLPENALKLYIVFSRPMQEGQALHYVNVIKNDKDTVAVFLDLAQELWNKERTTLTLWFDPGRIKRDLQPNKNLGTPLQENNRYKLIINKNWRDERGLETRANYEKDFFVGKRDSQSPDPADWNLEQPKSSTRDPLIIHFHESLDYLLLKNAVYITDNNGRTVNGAFKPSAKETMLGFIPSEMWQPAEYTINFESRLEDLAGNNLNRLFDRDLNQPGSGQQQKVYTKKIRIE